MEPTIGPSVTRVYVSERSSGDIVARVVLRWDSFRVTGSSMVKEHGVPIILSGIR